MGTPNPSTNVFGLPSEIDELLRPPRQKMYPLYEPHTDLSHRVFPHRDPHPTCFLGDPPLTHLLASLRCKRSRHSRALCSHVVGYSNASNILSGIYDMERPFQCSVCWKRFSRSDNLTQHARIHARSSDSGAATFGQGMFGDEGADADNEGLDHLDDDDGDFVAYTSTRLVKVEV
jgi:hypothetical protein